jgi:formylglycine-generating enzyme required for sulfatase activity
MRATSSLLVAATVAMAFTTAVPVEALSAGTRGVTVRLRDSDSANAPVTEEVNLYGSSHALVIGIDRYTKGWPTLSNAVKDAQVVAQELREKGFQVSLKTDLTSDALRRELRSFFAIKGSDPDARLLLWYAGHGHTMDGEGFLVPADAPPATDPTFLVSSLHMRDFGGLMRLAKSKHVLSVFDSCFSGTIFQARSGAAPAAITRKTTKPVRQFLTSGDAGQQVRDDGSFRELFVRAIRGDERADVNSDGYVTGEELGLFLSQRMATLTSAAQTPKYGKLHDVKFDQGDFVFVLPGGSGTASASATVTSSGTSAEVAFWQSIQDSKNPAMFEEYLRQYPSGRFAGLARLKIEELKTTRVASLPPAVTFQVTPLDEEMVAAKNANVRAEPTTTAEKIGRLSAGTTIGVTGRTKVSGAAWYRVALAGNRTGYVFGTLLTEVVAVVPLQPSPQVSPVKPAVGVFPTKPRYEPGDTFKDCRECPEMVVVPPGSFRMGDLSGGGDYSEKPIHSVNIGYKFAVGKYEVTRGEFAAFIRESGHRMEDGCWVRNAVEREMEADGSKNWRNPGFKQTDRDPVVCVSWNDAKEYARWLGRDSGVRYRLLSEAEWEYMARASSTSKYPFGNSEGSLCEHGNAADRSTGVDWRNKSCSDGYGEQTAPVGNFKPNSFGVYDTVGNVLEWVEDCLYDNYNGAPTNGSSWTGSGECRHRVLRGGSWLYKPRAVRSASRAGIEPDFRSSYNGFRIARALSQSSASMSRQLAAVVPPKPSPAPSPVQPVVGVFPTKPRYEPGDTFETELAGPHPLSGATVANKRPLADELDLDAFAPGVYVLAIRRGSIAQRLSFRTGDRIEEINGQGVNTVAALKELLDNLADRWDIVINRNDETLTLTIQP